MRSLKKTEDYFDFPETILDTESIPAYQEFADNPIFWEIYQNLHQLNSNQIILFNGLPRTGKSEACLDFAYALDIDYKTGEHLFNLKNMAYTLKDYLKLIKKNNRIGEALLWEEAGLAEYGANARDFLSKDNKDASTIFQSMGFKRTLNLINLPLKTMMDKQVRSLVHWIVVTEKINTKNMCRARIYQAKLQAIKDEVWTPRYTFVDSHGSQKKVNGIRIPRAPKPLRKEYKIISDAFKQDVQEMIGKRDSEWKKLPFITAEGDVLSKQLFGFLQDNMGAYLDLKTKKVSVDHLLVMNNIPASLKTRLNNVVRVFNTDLISGRQKYSADSLEQIDRFEEQKKAKRRKARKEEKEEAKDEFVDDFRSKLRYAGGIKQ